MTSLSNVIAELESCRYRTEKGMCKEKHTELQNDLKPYVARHLENGLGRLNIKKFHDRHLDWIEKTQSSSLAHLCTAVAKALGSAVEQSWNLQRWASRTPEYLDDVDIGRTITVNAIDRLITTFRQFEVVPDDVELQLEGNKRMILRYLKKALRLVITLGKLLGYSIWYDYYEENINQLDTFEFDRSWNCEKALNPTLPAVLDQPILVPLNHPPRNPGMPLSYRHDGVSGPGVLVNDPLPEARVKEEFPESFDYFQLM